MVIGDLVVDENFRIHRQIRPSARLLIPGPQAHTGTQATGKCTLAYTGWLTVAKGEIPHV